jgi:flagellar basal body-associated protein FliL
MYETDDIVEKKKRQKRKKNLIRFIIIFIVLVIAAVIIVTYEIWLPKLRGLGKQYTTIVNDGRLAEGNFPIEILDSESFQMACADNIL